MNIMMLLADVPGLRAPEGRPAIEWQRSGYDKGAARHLLNPVYATRVRGAGDADGDLLPCLRARLDEGTLLVGADGAEIAVGRAEQGIDERIVVEDLQRRVDAVLLWEHRLHAEALNGLDFRSTLEVGRVFTGCDMVLFDEGFRMLAYTSGAPSPSLELAYVIEHGYATPVSNEHMQLYQELAAEGKRGFTIANIRFSGDGSTFETVEEERVWVRSLRTRRGHRFRLHVVGAREGDQAAVALFESLADSLCGQLERLESIGEAGLKGGFIQELVSGSCGDEEATVRARSFGLDPQGSYLAVRIESHDAVFPQLRWEDVRLQVARELPWAHVAGMEDGVVLLLTGERLDDESRRKLSQTARREKVCVGVGDPVRGVQNVARSYRQACEAARERGAASGMGHGVLDYDDCKLAAARRAIEASDGHNGLVPLCVQRAREYDAAHETVYAPTLMAYYRHARNKADTCKDLLIHRNTLDYRLARAGELFGVDFADDDFNALMTLLAVSGVG